MAVKPTPNNSLYKGLVFDGVDSRDYGIYVTGEAVFNSPERDVEMIEIPGRNGAYALDKGRFGNIEVSYPAGIFGDTEADFREGIRAFRNALASRKGYKRLEDDYNPTEYRMAVYKSGLEVTPTALKAGEFTITFDCQPQRFLKSGETAVTIGGDVTNQQTKSGSIVSIESDGGDAVTSLVAQIDPVQSGSGDPSPTNVRPITGHTAANVNVAGKNLIGFKSLLDKWGSAYTDVGDGSYNVTNTGAGYREPFRFSSKDIDVTLSGEITQLGGASGWRLQLLNSSGETVASLGSGSTTLSGKGCKLRLNYSTVGEGANYKNIQLELGTTATAYEPYKGTTYPVSFGSAGTVYGGTVDVVTGVLTVTHKAETFNGTEPWGSEQSGRLTNYYLNLDNAGKMAGRQGGLLDDEMMCNWLAPSSSITTYGVYVGSTSKFLNCKCSSASDVASFKAMLTATPLVVVYPLATPQTYNLTAQQVELLTGENNVWADTGDITLTYGADPYKLVNPTLFESHPLLHLWGYGNIGINGEQLSINNDQYGNILLVDKTTHESTSLYKYIYHNTASPNPKVSLMNEGDTLTLVNGSFISVQLYGRPVVRFTNVSVSVGGGITTSVPSGATQIKNILLTFPEYTFSFGTAESETIPITITAAYTYEGAQRTATVTGDIRVVYSVGSSYQAVSIAIINITNTGSADFSVSTNPDKNGTLQAIYGYSTKRPFADDADFYFDLDIGEAYKIEDGQTISVNNAVTIPAKLPTLNSGENTITYDDTITQFKVVPRWWEV